ncbi:MAG: Holliday junction resolvase RecU [Culicoidibacterales bacterium]
MVAFQAPKHIQRSKSKSTSFHGRGARFEDTINRANMYYITNQIASIHKKPTPIQVVSVNYPKRSAAKIVEAYYKTPSTTDYNGVYRGKHIDFEAKETENKTRFPLQNIMEHQIEHLKLVALCGGISFLLISFSKLDRIFLLDASFISKELQQKSYIPLSFIEEFGIEIEHSNQLYLNYLHAVDILLDQKGVK